MKLGRLAVKAGGGLSWGSMDLARAALALTSVSQCPIYSVLQWLA